ncbi:cysteine--tRNA ligase [Roseovarius sp.]|uniref:cysteine--tRNA ligase n=1 Tax=Roseovarius sp. TaxID=1486281 RepID=UPI003A970D7C
MTTIKLHNTRSRKKEDFKPLDPTNVRMYVCGPTVYDRAHLGNARPVVVFDVLYRLLRHVYGAEHVTYVRNFTDVDDKINARASESGRSIGEITAETTQWFLDDMAALGALEPDHMPRATQYIPQMVAMIEGLIAKGHAYEAEGHVLFAVDSWREGYGKLSGRSVDDMIAGARVEVAPYKRNPMDFVLWKPSSEDLPGWNSPWGRGRPGWHIECSAMAHELLGESFDIHGGGNDLMFPHHENEIAQSCCAHPEGQFARYWLHNEMLQVEGKKMSKSLGNFFTVRDLLDQGIPGEVIRMSFLLSHYRDPMDFGVKRRYEARNFVTDFAKGLAQGGTEVLQDLSCAAPFEEVVAALADDLDTYSAIESIRKRLKQMPKAPEELACFLSQLYSSQKLLGFDLKDSKTAIDWARYKDQFTNVVFKALLDQQESMIRENLSELARRIDRAREEKDYDTADQLKAAISAAGAEVNNSPTGTRIIRLPDFDPSKLEALK